MAQRISGAAIQGREGVFVERESLLQSQFAQAHIVFFAAGEIGEQRAPALGGQDAQVDAEAVVQDDARLGRAGGSDAFGLRQRAKVGHDRLSLVRGDAAGQRRRWSLSCAAATRQRPCSVTPGSSASSAEDCFGNGQGVAQQGTAVAMLLQRGNGEQQFFLALLAQAGQVGQFAFVGDGREFGKGRDAQLLVNLLHTFWTQPLHAQQIDQRGRDLFRQARIEFQFAGGQHFLDFGRQRFADAGDLFQRAFSIDQVDVTAESR